MAISRTYSSLLTATLSVLLCSTVLSQELVGTFKDSESNFYRHDTYSGFLLSKDSWDRGLFEIDMKALLQKGYVETFGVTNYMLEDQGFKV